MHFTALLTLVAAIIPAVTPVPAPSPQTAEIDVHLELTSKDVADFFNEHKTKTYPTHNADDAPGQSLPYTFVLRLIQGIADIHPLPPNTLYRFKNSQLGEQGILSTIPSNFRLQNGKLLIGDKAVGLQGGIEKLAVPAILVDPQEGINFAAERGIGSDKTVLYFVDQRLTFLGQKMVSGIGDGVGVSLQPDKNIIYPRPTIITWELVRRLDRMGEDESGNQGPYHYEEYDQDVLTEI